MEFLCYLVDSIEDNVQQKKSKNLHENMNLVAIYIYCVKKGNLCMFYNVPFIRDQTIYFTTLASIFVATLPCGELGSTKLSHGDKHLY